MSAPIIIRAVAHEFVPHTGYAGCPTKLDEFAEYLAEGYSPADAARIVYGTSGCGNSMLQRIRRRLGPQAR